MKVNGLWCAAAGVCTCSAACKVQKMSPAERLGGSWWEGVGGARKKTKQTTEQPAACEGSSGTRSRRTASHYLLFRRAVAVAFSSQGKLAHIDRKHLTTLARSLSFFFSPRCGRVRIHCIYANIYCCFRQSVFADRLFWSVARMLATERAARWRVVSEATFKTLKRRKPTEGPAEDDKRYRGYREKWEKRRYLELCFSTTAPRHTSVP